MKLSEKKEGGTDGGREFIHFVGIVIPGSYLLLSGSPLNDYILSSFLL